MEMYKIRISIIVLLTIGLANISIAQCENTATKCTSLIPNTYILDGQEYRALLVNDETAEFVATFYSNTTYRIAGCSNDNKGGLEFSLVDYQNNQIFSNKNFGNTPYWDFKFNSTVTLIIRAHLNSQEYSGCAVMLIGFKP